MLLIVKAIKLALTRVKEYILREQRLQTLCTQLSVLTPEIPLFRSLLGSFFGHQLYGGVELLSTGRHQRTACFLSFNELIGLFVEKPIFWHCLDRCKLTSLSSMSYTKLGWVRSIVREMSLS